MIDSSSTYSAREADNTVHTHTQSQPEADAKEVSSCGRKGLSQSSQRITHDATAAKLQVNLIQGRTPISKYKRTDISIRQLQHHLQFEQNTAPTRLRRSDFIFNSKHSNELLILFYTDNSMDSAHCLSRSGLE